MPANPSAARLRALAQEFATVAGNATPGPWYANVNDLIGGYCVGTVNAPAADGVADMMSQEAAAFVAFCGSHRAEIAAALSLAADIAEPSEEAVEVVMRGLDTVLGDTAWSSGMKRNLARAALAAIAARGRGE